MRVSQLFGILLVAVLFTVPAGAADAELDQALTGLGAASRKTIERSARALGELGDPNALPSLQALLDRRLRAAPDGTLVILDESGTGARDARTGGAVDLPEGLRTPVINNKVRRVLKAAIARLQLFSDDPDERRAAAEELTRKPRPGAQDDLQRALERETHAGARAAMTLALALVDLQGEDPGRRLAAVRALGQTGDPSYKPYLLPLAEPPEGGPVPTELQEAARLAIKDIDRHQSLVGAARNLFYGLSLGSVLLLAALGLAITFGLMGVINMAHGEMLMLGAYATYVIQRVFQAHLPGWFDAYLLAAIPVAFVVTAAVGMALERAIIRHLYGRPLETLLATWGISLVLIQAVRQVFGAQNVEVANPAWLSGGVEVAQGFVLTYNRLAILGFVVFGVTLVWLLLQKTSLGLKVRAVTQNRRMASCMGVAASRVDTWTFGLGSGIAGLGGVALSQIGNVGPELGQGYIVDSFMVVVLGGVGKLAGAVCGALSLGMANKVLEPFTGAVLGKIFVLGFLILFIQKRPQGMFALKGRAAEG